MRPLRTIGVLVATAAVTLAVLPGSATAAGVDGAGSVRSGGAGESGGAVRGGKADRVLDAGSLVAKGGTNGFAVDHWYSGTVAAGESQHWIWNNVPLNTAYHVGFSPTGASTSAPCSFQLMDNYYESTNTGERRYHYIFKNIGSIACGANILMSGVSAASSVSTGGMNPGETKTLYYPWDVDSSQAYLPSLLPSGATSTQNCYFKVLRSSFIRQRSGDVATPVRLRVEVQNIGSIACTAGLEVGTDPVDSYLSWSTISPGQTVGKTWNNANPTSAVHVINMQPDNLNCHVQVTRSYYRQVINSNGSSERELILYYKNIGTTTCTARATLARI